MSRRAEDVVLPVATRTSGVQQAALLQAVDPVIGKPVTRAAAAGSRGEKPIGRQAGADQATVARTPDFEWIHLEILPPGKKPDPRGYAVYSEKQKHRPEPVPVILIDTAA